MKRLICEMCGSNELLKQDDRYVCQSCGTNYTTEEAKKLLIEVTGNVDVSGSTVKVDNSSFVQKSLDNARRAKSKEDWEECEKYYNMVEQYDPGNIEAIFYSSYGKAKMSMVESDRFKREQKMNVLVKSISIIDDNYDVSPEKYEDNKKLIIQIDNDISALVNGSFVYNQTTDGYGGTRTDKSYTIALFAWLCKCWVESIENIIKVIPDADDTVYLWKIIRSNSQYIYLFEPNNTTYYNKIQQTDEIIKKLDSGYVAPEIKERKRGCYIATCVYGSYDCPQVWTLRRYRDTTLASTWYGRAFIKIYYAISPTIVKLFGNTKWFKTIWKSKLDRFVLSLQAKGVKDTPYKGE